MRAGTRRIRLAVGTAAVCAAVVAGAVVTSGTTSASGDNPETPTEDASTVRHDRETVTRRTLEETSETSGTTGFGETRALNASAQGVVTEAHDTGDVLRSGDVAIRVAQRPIVVVDGSTPMFREMRRVGSGERDAAGDRLGPMTGPDVAQLQRYLIAEGFDGNGALEADGVYGLATEKAVKQWQRRFGHPATGRVDSGQIVFIDGPVRVETTPDVGQQFEDLTVTDLEPVITANITSKQRSYFAVGNAVDIELADTSILGTVTDLRRTTGGDGSVQYVVDVSPEVGSNVAGIESGEAAGLTATRVVAEDVLTVPVRALVALAEGGWAVELDTTDGPRLTAVKLGDVVDGFAEIDGLEEGAEVLVVVS